ncbi:MAG: hypothetical protein AAF391_05350, partial [Bacteroidota bacterium]
MKSINHKTIFLIDGVGACVSSFFLGYILVAFQSFIGMPVNVLYLLAGLALLFALYSLTKHFVQPQRW